MWSYSAVRPLFDDGKSDAKSVTRDYQIVTETSDSGAPLISVLGGKITTYRKLAEDVLREIKRFVPNLPPPWSATLSLPGGDFDHQGFEQQVTRLKVEYPFLSDEHASRLTRLYGTRARQLLGSAKGSLDLGRLFGSDLYELEVRYLIDQEWALSAEDILWRRTKEGLRLSRDQAQALDAFVKEAVGA